VTIRLSDLEVARVLSPYGFSADPRLCEVIRAYIALLLRWNQSISLTTVTDPIDILRFHIGESLFAVSKLPVENCRLADVGSGAGLPGIPLALASPGARIFLIESNTKKFTFLNEAIRELRLRNTVAIHSRMEDVQAGVIGGDRLNVVAGRAVGQMDKLLAWSARSLSEGGMAALWLGEDDAKIVSGTPGWLWTSDLIPGSMRRYLVTGTRA